MVVDLRYHALVGRASLIVSVLPSRRGCLGFAVSNSPKGVGSGSCATVWIEDRGGQSDQKGSQENRCRPQEERVRENSQNAALMESATPDFRTEQRCRNDEGKKRCRNGGRISSMGLRLTAPDKT